MKSRSLPIFIISFIAIVGLICSPSISFLSSNNVTGSYQAFATEDDSSGDSSSGDSSSGDNNGGSSSTDSFASPPVESSLPTADNIASTPPTTTTGNPPPDTQPSGGDSTPPVEAPPDDLAGPPPVITTDSPPDTQPSGGDSPPSNSFSTPPDTQPSGGDSPPSNSFSTPPANIASPDAGGGTGDGGTPDGGKEGDGDTPPANEGDNTGDNSFVGFIPKQSAQAANSQTDTQLVKEHGGFDDTLQDNTFDEGNGIITRDGTIIYNGKVTGHTKVTCGVNSQVPGCDPNSKATDSPKPPTKKPKPTTITPSQNGHRSGGGGGNGTPNIKIVNNEQQKVIVKVNTKVDTVTKNFITNNIFPSISSSQGKQKQPTFLLLLDTSQLCQIAGEVQCAVKQDQFKTFNLVTKLDSTGKNWIITGQTKNIASQSKSQGNVQVSGYFYDSKGNNVGGGSYKGVVNPSVLKSLQSGAFNIKGSTSVMKGTPSFLRLEYQTAA